MRKKTSSMMAKLCVGCAQVKEVSKNSSKESELPFSGIIFFTHASSYLTNDNNNDSEGDHVIITIIMIMIMITMAIMIQSCLILFKRTRSFFKLRN